MRLERREHRSRAWTVLAPGIGIVAGLVIAAPLMASSGVSLGEGYRVMADGAFGTRLNLMETFVVATPLVLTGLAVAVAFRGRLYNIGAEGQLYAGAIAATGVAFAFATWSGPFLLATMFLAGFLGGALLLLVPAVLKLRFRADEVVTTLLLNFVMILVVDLLIQGPWREPVQANVSRLIVDEARLPIVVERSRLHAGVFVALGLAVLMWVVLIRSRFGFQVNAVGSTLRAAQFTGVRTGRTIIAIALLGGGLAGVAGVTQLAGVSGHLSTGLSVNYGYTGIVIALLAQLHPLGVIAAAVFFAGISTGADNLSRTNEVPVYLADVIQASTLLTVLTVLLLTEYRVVLRQRVRVL